MNSVSKVLIGAVAGAALGALIAGLFATDEGAEARTRLYEGSKDLTNNLKEKLGTLKETVVETYDSVKQHATDLVQEGMSKASDVASNIK